MKTLAILILLFIAPSFAFATTSMRHLQDQYSDNTGYPYEQAAKKMRQENIKVKNMDYKKELKHQRKQYQRVNPSYKKTM